ncbi:hypothetical protein [Stenotrophomonas maltophilia]|uniref:hypothetical protein n=1 Tax=Stenotrophomonas maltophilia TaxID=40324 RepID=UPI0018EB1A04|nr:hypothetical protein [Stenotrophomonas maltophilia]
MAVEHCLGPVCFFHLDSAAPKIFGFAELLAGLAIMVLAWTIADYRYKFRIATAPIALHKGTFIVVLSVGILTLVSDLWRADGLLVPSGGFLTPAAWQVLLGGTFLLTFMVWTWFAFISPAKFQPKNARKFWNEAQRVVLNGDDRELTVLAEELGGTARSLINYAPNVDRLYRPFEPAPITTALNLNDVETHADDILHLMGDRKLCRNIVKHCPLAARSVLEAIRDTKRHHVAAGNFSRNILQEAIQDKESFLHREDGGPQGGFISDIQPLTRSLFGDYDLLKGQGFALDVNSKEGIGWSLSEWNAYFRVILIVIESYAKRSRSGRSETLQCAFHIISDATKDLQGVTPDNYNPSDEKLLKVRAVISFIHKAIEILDGGLTEGLVERRRSPATIWRRTICDDIAFLLSEIILRASSLPSHSIDIRVLWYADVWTPIFNSPEMRGTFGRLILWKLRRIIYFEIKELEQRNAKPGANLVSFCLQTMKDSGKRGYGAGSWPLYSFVKGWIAKNFSEIRERDRFFAMSLVPSGSMRYSHASNSIDLVISGQGNQRLVKLIQLRPRAE